MLLHPTQNSLQIITSIKHTVCQCVIINCKYKYNIHIYNCTHRLAWCKQYKLQSTYYCTNTYWAYKAGCVHKRHGNKLITAIRKKHVCYNPRQRFTFEAANCVDVVRYVTCYVLQINRAEYTPCPRKKQATNFRHNFATSLLRHFHNFEAFCLGIMCAWHSVAHKDTRNQRVTKLSVKRYIGLDRPKGYM